jgi:hypothetical protein
MNHPQVPANFIANKTSLFSSLVFIAQCLGLLKDYDVRLPDGRDKRNELATLS